MTKREFDLKEPCPCDRGDLYGDCCLPNDVRFFRDENGDIIKQVPMHEDVHDALEKQMSKFVNIFGREPGPGDRLLYEQYLYSKENHLNMFLEAAKKADLSQDLIYAYIKTDGLIVSENNIDKLSKGDLDEHNNAIDEYYALLESGVDPIELVLGSNQPIEIDNLIVSLEEACFWTIVHLGSLIEDKYLDAYKEVPSFYQFLIISRLIEVERSIFWVFEHQYSDTVFFSVRFLYESFLRLRGIRIKPEVAESYMARTGLASGIYKRSGKNLKEVATGKAIPTPPSNRELSQLNDEEGFLSNFHTIFYDYASTWSHPSFDILSSSFKENEGFRPHRSRNRFEGIMWAGVINSILSNEISKIDWLTQQRADDFLRLSLRIKRILIELAEFGIDQEEYGELIKSMLRLLKSMDPNDNQKNRKT